MNIYKIFNISTDFTFAELKKSYNDKINSIVDNVNYNDIDKIILVNKYKQYYVYALDILRTRNSRIQTSNVFNLLNPFGSIFDNISVNLFDEQKQEVPIDFLDNKQENKTYEETTYREYHSKTDENGTTLVYSNEETSKNGKKMRTSAYKQYSDGRIENINDKEIKYLMEH